MAIVDRHALDGCGLASLHKSDYLSFQKFFVGASIYSSVIIYIS